MAAVRPSIAPSASEPPAVVPAGCGSGQIATSYFSAAINRHAGSKREVASVRRVSQHWEAVPSTKLWPVKSSRPTCAAALAAIG